MRPEKLPFWSTVRDSIVLTARNAGVFFSYAWPYLIVLAICDGLAAWVHYPTFVRFTADAPSYQSSDAWADFAHTFVPAIVSLVIGAALAVPWHQFVVEGRVPDVSDPRQQSGRVLRYAGWGVATMLAFILAAVPIMLAVATFMPPELASDGSLLVSVGSWAMIVAFVVCLTPFYRFALILPAAALGGSARLRSVSYATKGNAFRLSFGSLLAAAPSMLLLEFMPGVVSRTGYVASQVANGMINMVVGMSIVTFLSLAYRHFAPAIAYAVAHDDDVARGQTG